MVDKLIEMLGVPANTVLNNRIPKKTFYEQAGMNKNEVAIFVDEVESIRLVSILNNDSINIEKYITEEHNYTDVAILYVELKNDSKYQIVARLIQQSIPYPVLVILGHKDHILFNAALKRNNLVEVGKIVIDEMCFSHWVNVGICNEIDKQFLGQVVINTLPYDNLYNFYTELYNRIFLTKLIGLLSFYPNSARNLDIVKVLIKQITGLIQEIEGLKRKHDKEKNFAKRMNIFMNYKELEIRLESLRENLKEVC